MAPFTPRQRLMTLLQINVILTHQQRMKLIARNLLKAIQTPTTAGKTKIRPRRWYVREWIRQREQFGHYHQLLPTLQEHDPQSYRYYLRVDPDFFNDMLQRVGPHITHQDTNWKKALEPGLRLAITLRFMATGEAYKSLAMNFRVGPNTICKLIPETCEAIIKEYLDETIVCPSTPEQWKRVAEGYSAAWNFHHVLGAIDGKHVAIQPPSHSGSYYFNYKGYHSIVMLAVVDAHGKFMYLDVGANGSCSDAGIFQVSHLRDALEKDQAGIPQMEPLAGENQNVPYFIVGDNAFPMREWLQKPYPHRGMQPDERNFNYRLSRARRVVENAFGMWANRFRLFLTTINLKPKTVEKLILASCIIHNMLRDKRPAQYPLPEHDPSVPQGDWTRDPLDGLEPRRRQTGPARAKTIRNYLTEYYNRPCNKLPWQR